MWRQLIIKHIRSCKKVLTALRIVTDRRKPNSWHLPVRHKQVMYLQYLFCFSSCENWLSPYFVQYLQTRPIRSWWLPFFVHFVHLSAYSPNSVFTPPLLQTYETREVLFYPELCPYILKLRFPKSDSITSHLTILLRQMNKMDSVSKEVAVFFCDFIFIYMRSVRSHKLGLPRDASRKCHVDTARFTRLNAPNSWVDIKLKFVYCQRSIRKRQRCQNPNIARFSPHRFIGYFL